MSIRSVWRGKNHAIRLVAERVAAKDRSPPRADQPRSIKRQISSTSWHAHLRGNPGHRGVAGADQPRGFSDSGSGRERRAYCSLPLRRERRPSKRLPAPGALCARPGDAGCDPLVDQRPLEFGEHAQHLEKRLTRGRACVYALPIEVQINPGAVELAEKGNEILQAAAETIDAPSRDDIELMPGYRLVQLV